MSIKERLSHTETAKRNSEIYHEWLKGHSYRQLAEDFSLGYTAIFKIIEKANKRVKLAATGSKRDFIDRET